MTSFEFCAMDIPGAYKITPFFSEDNRGFFVKSFERKTFQEYGIEFQCHESFISMSDQNVIRGMHFQLNHPQAKLVGVLSGEVYDVIVDLRRSSPTFGKWIGLYLSAKNRMKLYIPKGCAHGFLATQANTIMSYQCDGAYDKASDTGIRYDDPDLAIQWPTDTPNQFIVGERDQTLMTFMDFVEKCEFNYQEN